MADTRAPELAPLAADGSIPVVDRSGKVSYLPAALANEPAALEGLRRATVAELAGEQAQADERATKTALADKFSGSIGAEVEGAVAPALAGAARGLTLGASDKLLTELGGDGVRGRLRDYERYAPIGSAVGELGAISAAAAFGDEAGWANAPRLIGRLGLGAERGVATALGEGALARGAGVLARGAVEGAAFGAGQAVSESALEDHELTGESLLAGVAHGLAGGAVASGLLHGAGAAASKVFRLKPSAQALEQIAARDLGEATPGLGRKLAEEMPYRSPGKPTDEGLFDSLGQKFINAQPGLADDESRALGEVWKNRQVALNRGEDALDTHSRELSEAITKQQKASRIVDMETFGDSKVNHMEKLVSPSRFGEQASVVRSWMDEASEVAATMTGDANSGFGAIARKQFDGHMERLARAIESGEGAKLFAAADDAKRWLGKQAQFGKGPFGLSEAARAFDELYQGPRGLLGVLENGAWGRAGEAQRSINKATSESIGLGDRFRSKFTTAHGSEMGRPEYVANTDSVSSFIGRLTKPANDLDAQSMRDMISTRRRYLDATAEHYDHGSRALKAISDERQALDAMEKTLEKASKEASLINQAKRLQGEEQAAGIGGIVGLATDAFTRPMTMLRRMASLEQATKGVTDRIGRGVRRLLGKEAESTPGGTSGPGFFSKLLETAGDAARGAGVATRAGGVKVEKYVRESRQVAALQADPVALTARVGDALGPVSEGAPKVAAAATATAVKGLAFLASKMPPSRQDPYSLQPHLQPKMHASDAEIATFQRYREALDDPTIVLEKARKGTLTPEHVEAVKAVYPKLYERIQRTMFEELTASTRPVPYSRRIQLGVLLEIPTDATLAPDFVQAIQATYTAQDQSGREPPQPQLASVELASSLQTDMQSAASEGQVR